MAKFQSNYKKKLPQRVDKFLTQEIAGATRADIQNFIKSGALFVNGKVITKSSYQIKMGDAVELIDLGLIDDEEKAVEFKVVYEDAGMVIIEKPAGAVVYSLKKNKNDSLHAAVLKRYPEIKNVGEKGREGVVHRLDKQTSGLLVFAKNQPSYDYLKDLFRKREIKKEYLALVFGQMEKHGKIEQPLTKIGYKGQSRVGVSKAGRDSITEYWLSDVYLRGFESVRSRPLQRFSGRVGAGKNPDRLDQYSLVRVKLHTGRTHQIRVHFDSIGHPVMGDNLYGKPESMRLDDILERQFLHATRLEFKKPDGTWIEAESPLPEDLQNVLDKLETRNICHT